MTNRMEVCNYTSLRKEAEDKSICLPNSKILCFICRFYFYHFGRLSLIFLGILCLVAGLVP